MRFEPYFRWYMQEYFKRKKSTLNYPDGCVMTGAQGIYCASGQKEYLEAVLRFGDMYVEQTGDVTGYDPKIHNIDQLRCGTVFLWLYKKTGEEKYRKAANMFRDNLADFPRTSGGNFWHKEIYPYQVWLDGLYMGLVFYVEYGLIFDEPQNLEDALAQFSNVRKLLYVAETGLYKHAYDEKKEQPWADRNTGLSPSYWGRAAGWYIMALVDCFELLPEKEKEGRRLLGSLLSEAVSGLIRYEDSTGLFRQVLDQPHFPGNYLETSASAMAAYVMMKGTRLGILPETMWKRGEQILEAIDCLKLVEKEGRLHLTDICASAGLGPGNRRNGSVEYYLSEAREDDNAHGAAACMMAYGEWLRGNKNEKG